MHFPRFTRRGRASILATTALASAALLVATAPAASASDLPPVASLLTGWTAFGHDVFNNADQPLTRINAQNVPTLKEKWAFTTGGDISARAAVAGGVAYVPDWSGHVYAINASTGKQIWMKNIGTDYLGGIPGSTVVSRTSPFLDVLTNTLYIGTQAGAYLLAINAKTGELKWRTQLDSHPEAIDTGSPSEYNGLVYVGVASNEEAAAADPTYSCCSFRGSVVAVNAGTGAVQWKTYTVPSGYTGGAVWGSTIVPDPLHGTVYATTGNNYSAPNDPAYTGCIAAGGTNESCASPANHFDSVISLNMKTGAYVWADRFASADDWNVACIFAPGGNCPVNSGPDFDFGSGVQLFTISTATGIKTVIGAGQKSGVYSAIDTANGHVLWATQVGPGSSLGGIEWGSATDGQRIYVAIANLYGIPYAMSNGSTSTAGSWAALDPTTGHIIWQVADPNGSIDLAPMSVANGVVYGASMAGAPTAKTMFGLNASNGATLWSFAAGSSVNAGAVIADDTVYWGSGYSHLGIPGFTGNNKFYAFTLGGK